MTEAVRRKFDLLDQQYTRTLQQRQQQTLPYPAASSGPAASRTAHSTGTWGVHAAAEAGPIVEPQLLTVTVQGRVLSKAHIQAGSYIPAAEKEEALKLLAGEVDSCADRMRIAGLPLLCRLAGVLANMAIIFLGIAAVMNGC
jgi:hypothetical protein